MFLSPDEIKKFVNDSNCLPHDAACLINEIDPKKMVSISPLDHRQVSFNAEITELKELVKILAVEQFSWSRQHCIFYYVNIALRNPHITVSNILIDEISNYRLNLIKNEQTSFDEKYAYITRRINSTPKEEYITQLSFDMCFPNFPKNRDVIAEVIETATVNFINIYKKYPSNHQLWSYLRNCPPTPFLVKEQNKDLIIEDEVLTRKGFSDRMERYRKTS